MLFFFFFQAEDGIRDYKVTGVQTCALPISKYNVSPYLGFSPNGKNGLLRSTACALANAASGCRPVSFTSTSRPTAVIVGSWLARTLPSTGAVAGVIGVISWHRSQRLVTDWMVCSSSGGLFENVTSPLSVRSAVPSLSGVMGAHLVPFHSCHCKLRASGDAGSAPTTKDSTTLLNPAYPSSASWPM